MNKLLIVSVIAALGSIAGVANAAVLQSTTFEVNLTVQKTCTSSTSGALSFGNADVNSAQDPLGTTTISVKCSKGIAYTIGLQSGNNNGNSTGAGIMKGAQGNNDSIGYQLTRGDSSIGATAWGTGQSAVNNQKTDGTTETLTVYGRVPKGNLNVQPDTYKDTVTVVVTY